MPQTSALRSSAKLIPSIIKLSDTMVKTSHKCNDAVYHMGLFFYGVPRFKIPLSKFKYSNTVVSSY
jgi:hypothetical protein